MILPLLSLVLKRGACHNVDLPRKDSLFTLGLMGAPVELGKGSLAKLIPAAGHSWGRGNEHSRDSQHITGAALMRTQEEPASHPGQVPRPARPSG